MIDINSIRFRFVSLMVLIISLGFGMVAAWNHVANKTERQHELEAQLEAISARLTSSLQVAVWEYNHQQIAKIVNSEMSAPFVLGILVTYGKERTYGVHNVNGESQPIKSGSPGVFIPIAERFGLINAMGNWVIDEACRQMQAWARDGVRMCVAINLSVHQLRQDDLVERIRAALWRHQIDASQLMCEITESSAMDDIEISQRAFDGLAHIGVFLSIDDFGTGYSSLSYLRQLPARQLKIDRSFVHDLEASDDARAIVAAVVQLAHALGLRVVAEGVETEAQRDILLGLGCDELQGFFFAKPMAADVLADWIQEHRPQPPVELTPSAMAEIEDAALAAWSGT